MNLACLRCTNVLMLSGLLFVSATLSAQGSSPGLPAPDEDAASRAHPDKPLYSPYAGRGYPSRPYFGDTHLHTSFSMDAGAFGARLGPSDAYRFARGEEVMSSTGQPVRLSRPLDFLVVADHSDGFGFFPMIFRGDPEILADEQGRRWHEMVHAGEGARAAIEIITNFSQGTISPSILPLPGTKAYNHAWGLTIDAAEEANDPGRFTAFIGYEWSSNTQGMNLHRNVIFRDDRDKASQVVPFTAGPGGSDNPVELWKWMGDYEEKTGGDVLAIAHNGNLSNGRMFPVTEAFGSRIDKRYATTRAMWEPLYEATQTKGDGEAHPLLSPNDEFADFETWDRGNLDGSEAKKPEMLEFEYARSGLMNGLKLEGKLGVNPYRFGMIGSTDAHTGLAAVEEENFFGKTVPQEPNPHRISAPFINNPDTGVKIMDWEVSSSGFAAVWATENTREAIFDAMERRETYATTGTRMIVRFFGGWDFDDTDVHSRRPAVSGYRKGVPMGGELSNAPEGKVPTFLVAAAKDPIGANLDRIQIIKGWLDRKGNVHEQVYDVAWSDEDSRQPGADGKLPPVGYTVDVENANWTNTIGDPELITVWQDPDFDPEQRAFYYARILEIPTPRWPAYDAARLGVTAPAGARMMLQERGYTSPIWYSP